LIQFSERPAKCIWKIPRFFVTREMEVENEACRFQTLQEEKAELNYWSSDDVIFVEIARDKKTVKYTGHARHPHDVGVRSFIEVKNKFLVIAECSSCLSIRS
jgi:hypothetical protein